MNYLLSEAETPIRQALERLLEKDKSTHPFVVVNKVGRPDVVIQFAGSRQQPICFNVPLLGIAVEPMTPGAGAARAVDTLEFSLGVARNERVVIHEEEDSPSPWRGWPFRRGIFA